MSRLAWVAHAKDLEKSPKCACTWNQTWDILVISQACCTGLYGYKLHIPVSKCEFFSVILLQVIGEME